MAKLSERRRAKNYLSCRFLPSFPFFHIQISYRLTSFSIVQLFTIKIQYRPGIYAVYLPLLVLIFLLLSLKMHLSKAQVIHSGRMNTLLSVGW